MEPHEETTMRYATHHRQLGPDPEPLSKRRFEQLMRSDSSPRAPARRDAAEGSRPRRTTMRRPRRPRRVAPPPETPGQAHARRARMCAEAHARSVAALRELDTAVTRGEHWCDGLADELADAAARAADLPRS